MRRHNRSDLLYVRVARDLEAQIEAGTLRTGDRAPSIRGLSHQRGVSISTVIEAYSRLVERGYLEARPRSGFYVTMPGADALPEPRCPMPSLQPTEVGVGGFIAQIVGAALDPAKVPFGAACPGSALLPHRTLNRITREVLREHPDHSDRYAFPPGCTELRRQIARRSHGFGCNFAPEDLLITSGAIEALNLCLRAVAGPGDVIAVESPTYFGILQVIESLGMRTVEVPADARTGIAIGALEEAIRRQRVKACIAMTNCHNPLGAVLSEERKKALVELTAKHDVFLIEDDVYGDLANDGRRPKAAKAFDLKDTVLLCSSFSKVVAPGFRVGWLHAGRFRREVERLKFLSTLATPSLPQLVLARFLETGAFDRHLRSLRPALARQVARVTEAITRHFPEGTCVTRPSGGYLLWVQLPSPVDALRLHRRALAEGISILPGPMFSARRRFRRHVRLSCGHPWSEKIDGALRTLGQLAKELR
jgi:DNA-binding transcriptional MocR family regulator